MQPVSLTFLEDEGVQSIKIVKHTFSFSNSKVPRLSILFQGTFFRYSFAIQSHSVLSSTARVTKRKDVKQGALASCKVSNSPRQQNIVSSANQNTDYNFIVRLLTARALWHLNCFSCQRCPRGSSVFKAVKWYQKELSEGPCKRTQQVPTTPNIVECCWPIMLCPFAWS